jgi:voltage-gated potassium channel
MATRIGAWLRHPVSQRSLGGFVIHRLRWALVSLVALFLVATGGYVVIDHFSWLDAAFMTVITLSTVGYQEVHPLSPAGRLFTIGVIIAGFGTLIYTAAMITELFTSRDALEHLRQARGRRMRETLDNHVIVVGFGRVGQAVAAGVLDLGSTCLVIDRSPEHEPLIRQAGCVSLVGDATDEEDLVEAGIHRARALVAAAERDDINLVVTLTARAIRSDLRIISRVNEGAWRARIVRAGADIAQSPYPSYGASLATSALTPGMLDVHALPLLGLGTEEIQIGPESKLIGRRLAEVSQVTKGVYIVGLRREHRLHRWHDVHGAIAEGDVLVALGTAESLRALTLGSDLPEATKRP